MERVTLRMEFWSCWVKGWTFWMKVWTFGQYKAALPNISVTQQIFLLKQGIQRLQQLDLNMFSQAMATSLNLLTLLTLGVSSAHSVNQLGVMDCLGSSCSSPAPPSCSGSIKLHSPPAVHSFSSSDMLDVVNYRFGEIVSITVDGNCCWRVATRRNGAGTTRDFTQAVANTNHQV